MSIVNFEIKTGENIIWKACFRSTDVKGIVFGENEGSEFPFCVTLYTTTEKIITNFDTREKALELYNHLSSQIT